MDDSGSDTDVEVENVARIRIFQEPFHVEFAEEGLVYLTHPRWSIAGSGQDLETAYLDLLAEARELAEVMVDFDPASLDKSALSLRRWVLPLLHFTS